MNHCEITKNAKDLIYLVSCAANRITPDAKRCAEMDDASVFRLASLHMLAAAAACALEKVMPLPQHWISAKGNSKRRLIIYQAERARILRAFDERGIWYLPLKGILIKDMYPESSMREMSDNDILCDSEKMSEVREVMESLGFSCVQYGNLKHDVYHKNPLCFEMHANLLNSVEYPEAYTYYKNIKERLIKDDSNLCGYHMTNEDFYIYCINHMYKHFSKAGTGLRSLLDIYIINKSIGQTLDRGYISRELEYFGVRDFESKTRQLAEKVFSFQPLTDSDKAELALYTDSGTFGSVENLVVRSLKNEGSKHTKQRYIRRRVFPNEGHLKLYYPVVYRHRVLYPLLVVYRPFKGLITQRKKLFGEIKALKKFKSTDETGDC
ncbi:MAG: nucleotidyltransferase family protein [Eubacteriales bacterium]|nr:nucleotidyltransferase family protein [Eubacteriales bacterium]